MTTLQNFVSDILLEAALDPRIDDGMVNLSNHEHIQVLAEYLMDAGYEMPTIVEAINNVIAKEGKFPDRQAYNREGWLVTFPSAQYKQAAIKKGTHFSSDPTHGKGGMNIYYKKKGKQKRMTQQDTSVVEPSDPASQPQAPANGQEPVTPAAQPAVAPEAPATPSGGGSSLTKSDGASDKGGDDVKPVIPTDDSSDGKTAPTGTSGGKPAATPDGAPAQATPPPPPAAPPAPNHTSISIEFAKSKQWNPTPYGEWKNLMGETAAVVGLSGEVVPIKSTDREELKLFSARKSP